MANDDRDDSIVLIRSTNSVGKELEYKVGFWYVNRHELAQAVFVGVPLCSLVVGLPLWLMKCEVIASILCPVGGLAMGMHIISKWKYNKRPSYMWDTLHRLGVVGNRTRFMKRTKDDVVLVPYPKPIASSFAGTTDGGLGRIHPHQETDGLPNWNDPREDGTPGPSVLGFESAIGRIVIVDWEEGEGPAPGYWEGMEPPPGRTERDMVAPTIPYRQRKTEVPWKELA